MTAALFVQVSAMTFGGLMLNLAIMWRQPLLALLSGAVFAAAIHWGPR